MSAAEQPWTHWVQLRNILLAMDLSPSSERALPFAVNLARHYAGKVFVAHVVPSPHYDVRNAASLAKVSKLETGAEKGLLSTIGSQLGEVPHEVLLDHGSLSARLLDAANRWNVDLIVLGTHGWQGIRRMLKGSTADEMAHLATRPVLTVGPNVSTPTEFRRVLYETDFSPAAAHAIPYAMSVAHAYRAALSLLHVNVWGSREPPVEAAPSVDHFFHEQMRRFGYDASQANLELLVEFGARDDRILDVAAHRAADLIVMGLNCTTGLRARLAAHLPGSTVYNVVSQAHCPVLTVPFSG
jgi:nucleotide-binding universal stress UspA family protein